MNRIQLYSITAETALEENLLQTGRRIGLAIGNFDGLHLGHQKLLTTLVDYCRPLKLLPCALNFSPHPRVFFGGQSILKLASDQISDLLLHNIGIERLYIQEFYRDFAQLPPEEFIEKFLYQKLHTQVVCIGENFRFGVNRTGVPSFLANHGKNFGMESLVVKSEFYHGKEISSSRIRTALEEGDLPSVNAMLGRPYSIEGKLVSGRQLGRTIDIPTLNIDSREQTIPKIGVYSGYTTLFTGTKEQNLKSLPSVINIGFAPTVTSRESSLGKSPEMRIEAHIIEPSRSYGKFMDGTAVEPDQASKNLLLNSVGIKGVQLTFIDRLRPEMKFTGIEELKNQIFKDINLAVKGL